MYSLAFRFSGQRADAEDQVQDVLLKLFPRLTEMQAIEKLSPWLARVLYRHFIKLEARGRHELSKQDRVYLRYRYEDISSDDVVFDYTEGWRQKLRAEFRRYNKNAIQFYYELELNDRNDFVSTITNNVFSYSPTRHTLRRKYTFPINNLWKLTTDLAYRKSDYPSTATQKRNDKRWKAAIYANYRFDKSMKLKL